ncbi:UNVERIFIED_CONTAM: hypothetical protein Slati_1507400 [Sesamum latifolium]|uniref:Retrotransposon gag domain-containing protein n=1 Tax=Sesamum latifolium TaxID=2727402 RepID=A0AAW2X7P8_9LAMI
MVTNTTTLEEQIANLTKAIEGLAKHVQEQDSQITKLMNKIDSTDASHIAGKQMEAHDEAETSLKQQSNEREKSSTKELQVSSEGLIPVDQLKEFIMGTIQSKLSGSSKSSMAYTKPYTQRIDDLKMPVGYQPPKDLWDHLVKQFVRSLKGNAFDWYTDLEASSIDSWEQLEQEFLNRFYSTRRTVSMIELTNTPVERRTRHRLYQPMEKSEPQLSRGAAYPRTRKFKEKQEAKKGGRSFSKPPVKEAMAVNTTPFKLRGKLNDTSGEKKDAPQERWPRKLTLKEMQTKQYPFLDSDVSGIFDDLLNANLIELPEMKRPEEAGKTDDPKYCKYHRLVGHSIHDCFI